MKPKAMISQPMRGRTDEEILATRAKAKAVLEAKGFEVVETWFKDEWENWADKEGTNPRLWFLSKAIERMAHCQAVYFCKDWEQAAGCQIEHVVAMKYGLEVIEEDKEEK